jgi:hypothetical protein
MDDTDLTPEEAASEGIDSYDGDAEVPLNPRRMERLRSMHTRKLMQLLRDRYGRSTWWENHEAWEYDDYTTAEIKAVLATRLSVEPEKIQLTVKSSINPNGPHYTGFPLGIKP